MEERKITLEPVIWWGIDAKNEVSKYDSPESISRITYWIKQTDVGERYTTMYGNTYEIYQYEIFDINLTNTKIVFNNWKIRRIYDPQGKSSYNHTKFEFVDPFNELRTIQFFSLKDAFKSLNEISEYENWQNYDLNVLNTKINEENKNLTEENEELHSKIDAFMSTRLYKRMSTKVEHFSKSKLKSKETHKLFNKEFSVNSNFIRQWFKT